MFKISQKNRKPTGKTLCNCLTLILYVHARSPNAFVGDCREEEVLEIFLEAFSHSQNPKEVTYSEFEDYYEGLSLCVDSDQDFENILKNSWSI